MYEDCSDFRKGGKRDVNTAAFPSRTPASSGSLREDLRSAEATAMWYISSFVDPQGCPKSPEQRHLTWMAKQHQVAECHHNLNQPGWRRQHNHRSATCLTDQSTRFSLILSSVEHKAQNAITSYQRKQSNQ